MDGVTDQPFRHIQKKYGQPAVMYTEFTSVEGVCHGAERLLEDFLYDESQRPIVGQIYGTTPDFFRQTAIILCQLGFDGIDINMGCPAKNVAHSGAGAALIKTPELASQIITAVQLGIEQWQQGATVADCSNVSPSIQTQISRRLSLLPPHASQIRQVPVSVKTRVGFDSQVVESWIPTLLNHNLAAIAVHGRTLKQQYGGQADWPAIGRAAQLAHQYSETLLLGNGDVRNAVDALEKVAEFGVDGVLLGRAAMGNPFVLGATANLDQPQPSIFAIALEHTQLYEQTYMANERYSFLPMRKHLGWYVREVPNASQIRIELFQTNTSQEVAAVLQRHGLL